MFFAEFCHGALGEVGAIVRYYTLRVAIPVDELAYELGCRLAVALLDWLGLDPLGELVDRDQEVGETGWGLLERAYHVHAPYGEWPCDGDGLECQTREVRLVGILLASDAPLDDVDGVSVRGEPVEVVSHGFGDQRPGAGVMAAVTGVDVLEDLASLFWLYAALEHASHAASVELVVYDDEGFTVAYNQSRLCLVAW